MTMTAHTDKAIRRLVLAVSFLLLFVATASAETPTWYVAASGSDAWSGTLEEPNAEKTDGPKATLDAARDASRTKSETPRRIQIGPGRFYLNETLQLDARDSRLSIVGAGQGKTILYGGRRVAGWTQADDGPLWVAKLPDDLPEWSFRVLLVNDALQDRARLPETGYLEHETKFPVRWMSSAGGGWERKPTEEEYKTMQYKAGDLPADLNLKNAEVTVCHMWDESTVTLAAHDPTSRTLTFTERGTHPPGAFGVQRYVVWNTKQGMTRPGQWYLDRQDRKLYYWPPAGVDMAKALVIAPTMQTLVKIDGNSKQPVAQLAIQNLSLSASDAPMRPGGFGALRWPGTLAANHTDQLLIQQVDVSQAGCWGIKVGHGKGLAIRDCRVHHLGGGGIEFSSNGGCVEGNQVHDVGLVSASALGIRGYGQEGEKSVIRRNVVHDTPYSGMNVGGTELVIEENLIYRCMKVLHDGAAIYMFGGQRCIMRRNFVRDIVEVGSGYGASAYYLDEKSRECVVAENVSVGTPTPTHNHMTLNCELRDNVFITPGDMKLSFARSSGYKVRGNTFHVGGKLEVRQPDAITQWDGNLIFENDAQNPRVLEDFPMKPFSPREKPRYLKPTKLASAVTVDGELGDNEWPAGGTSLYERPNQRSVRGAPIAAKFATDGTHLYILTNVVAMFPDQRRLGTKWQEDEGVELVLQDKGKTTYVLRGFTDGTLQSLPLGGATDEQAKAFASQVKYAASAENKKPWRSEWAIPLSALGIEPDEKILLPLNLTVYRSEDNVLAQLAGTLGETWDLNLGGRLMLNWKD